jgi:ferredoxin-NADP reductase
MARAAVPGRLNWQLGNVVELIRETARTCSIVLDMPDWAGHRAGQHVDVRLTAEDGYQAQRSYSIASAPEDDHLVLTVERLDDGEVSPYLADELIAGDQLELRGPIGGYFVWEDQHQHPVLLVAGGSGVVPFRSMLRHRQAVGSQTPVRLIYSARSLDEVVYRKELEHAAEQNGVDVRLTLTRQWPDDWTGLRGRVDRAVLEELSWPPTEHSLSFVCGPNGFVETVASTLSEAGHPDSLVRTERFGPTG